MTTLPAARFLDWFVVCGIGVILGAVMAHLWLTRSV
jgi:hypothetical protein